MNEDLRTYISEHYDGGAWDAITPIYWKNGQPWQLWKFEHDVDFDGYRWRCVIIRRDEIDPEDISAVNYSEDVFADAWEI